MGKPGIRCLPNQRWDEAARRRRQYPSFLAQGLDLLDQGVDFFRRQLADVLGHAAFAVGDDVAQLMGGGGGVFFGDE